MNDKKISPISKSIDDFAYKASHDLQEPIRKILGFSDLLKNSSESQISEEGLEYLSIIENAATRLQTMLNGLIEYNWQGDTTEPKATDISLLDTLNQAKNKLSTLSEERSAIIEVESNGDAKLIGSSRQLTSLFYQLFKNSIQFCTKTQKPKIKVQILDSEQSIQVSIKDNGIGMDKKDHQKAFELFGKLDKNTGGAGVGLPLSKKIVLNHQGIISIESASGSGTTIHITFKKPTFSSP